MKNSSSAVLPLVVLIGAMGANTVNAQAQTSAGIQIGLNIANVSYTSAMSGVSSSSRTGLLLGGIVTVDGPGNLCFRAEPMYVQNGATMTIELGQNLSYKEIYKLEYLEIPLQVMLRIGDGPLRPYVFGGPNLGILIAANLEEEMPPIFAGNEGEFRQSGTSDIMDEISSTNFSVDLGGGVAYDMTPEIQLLADVRYSLGLSNIAVPPDPNDQSFQPDCWKSRDVKILVGVMFAL